MGLRVRLNLMTLALAVKSVRQGDRNRMFMSVVVISASGPASVIRKQICVLQAPAMTALDLWT
jgi:hypothetical protein